MTEHPSAEIVLSRRPAFEGARFRLQSTPAAASPGSYGQFTLNKLVYVNPEVPQTPIFPEGRDDSLH